MDVFRSMGGTVLLPKRSHHIPKYTPLTVARDDFMMDFENSCLSQKWDSTKGHPRGPKRYEDHEWAAMIQSQVYPNHSDVDWEEYIDWTSAGHGDEWFQAEEDEEEFQAESEEDEEEEGDLFMPRYGAPVLNITG